MTPILAAAACAVAPSAASAQASYPTADGLITASFSGGVTSVWPDGTHVDDFMVNGVVGTFDGNGNYLSVRTGNHVVAQISVETRQSVSNLSADTAIGATAMSPAGNNVEAIVDGKLSSYGGVVSGSSVWNAQEPAVGRFGWATLAGKQRKIYVAGPGGLNGGGQDVTGSVMVLEQGGSKFGISAPLGAQNPTISPDGNWAAFEMDNNGQRDVYLKEIDADSNAILAADQTSADEYLPTFSPDSSRLVFARADGSSTQLREVPIGSIAASRHVTTIPQSDATGLAWQPSVKPTAGSVTLDATSAVVGTELTFTDNAAADTGYKPRETTYTWESCVPIARRDDDGCTDVGSGSKYTPKDSDIGRYLRVRKLVQNPAGGDSKYSGYTEAVVAPVNPPAAPTFTSTPAKVTNEYYPHFSFTGENLPNGTFECRVVNGWGRAGSDGDTGWIPCTSPAGTLPLENGQYTYMVRQLNGTVPGDVAYYAFTVDHDGPAKPEIIMTRAKDLTASVTFISGSDEPVTFECRLDGPVEVRDIDHGPKWESCNGAWSGSDLAEGPHKLEIRARDKAGNISEYAVATWTNKKPVVVPPAPVVETPAPAPAPAPVVETPKPAAPRAVTVPKAPALTATIGGTKSGAQVGANGGTSSAAVIEVAKESVGVGCSITGTVLKSCKVDLYAPRASGAVARAAASSLVLVGTGTYESKAGSKEMDVKIELNSVGRKMLRANPAGLRVQVKILGKPVSGKPLKATGVAKLVTDRASLTVGGFKVRSSVLTAKAKRELRTLAKFGKAHRVTCVGHTDGSSQDDDYLKSLGARRAKAVCSYLAKHGLKPAARKLVSKADTKPAATNATKAGRAKNRRVQVTIVR